MREIKKIVIHCSDSDWGTRNDIDAWHKERGWDGIGYHYVITNGVRQSCYKYIADDDGIIQNGRPIEKQGAHVKGHNKDSVGICLIGRHHFTGKQLYNALPTILNLLMVSYHLTPEDIYGHNQYDPDKTCPTFDVGWLRAMLIKADE